MLKIDYKLEQVGTNKQFTISSGLKGELLGGGAKVHTYR